MAMSANEGGIASNNNIAAEMAPNAVEHMLVWNISLKAIAPVKQWDPTAKVSRQTNAAAKILEPIPLPNSSDPTSA